MEWDAECAALTSSDFLQLHKINKVWLNPDMR
jgi:hypothetical protein